MIEHLNIQDENRIRINTYNRDILVSFFEPGKFSNAYVEYAENITYNQKMGFHYLTGIPFCKDDGSIKLYLPNNKEYFLLIRNRLGTCSIKNGKQVTLGIQANNIYLENVDAKGNVFCNNYLPHSSIILKNSTIDRVDGAAETIDISNSSIKRVQNDNSYVDINIKDNSVIDELCSAEYKLAHPSKAKTKVTDSTIKTINYKMATLKLENCNIGNMKCSNGEVGISKCNFITPNTIEIYDNCHFYFNERDQYTVKKSPFDQIKIQDKEKKKSKTKVMVHKGTFIHNQVAIINTKRYERYLR